MATAAGEFDFAGDFSIGSGESPEFPGGINLLDTIDFDDLFLGLDGADQLPDLEISPEILAEVSAGAGFGVEEPEGESPAILVDNCEVAAVEVESKSKLEGKKSTLLNNNNNNNPEKRKAKVDWTGELHRRFVEVVEQLGVDKAVPSQILELMSLPSLTRHHIASHLQKYRSHRKHLPARKVEATTRTPKCPIYGVAASGGGKGDANMNPWHAPPTIGYPPSMTPLHHHHQHHRLRPLHVWGHPTVDHRHTTMMPLMWPPPAWVMPPCHPPLNSHFWFSARVPAPTPTPTPVPRIPPPHGIFRPDHSHHKPPAQGRHHRPSFDFLPSKESIDAAIGDVLARPCLPLPIGLKPPSIDTVLVELERHGVSNIPPNYA